MKEYRNWHGSGEDLAETVTELLDALGLGGQQIRERLVRYYVQQGVLTRPEREGREAIYAYRQLLELVVARLMADDGWPLAKIAEFNRGADEKALLDLVPKRSVRVSAPGTAGEVEVTAHLKEKLALEGSLPPYRLTEKVELYIDGRFSVVFDKADFETMSAARATKYTNQLRDLLKIAVQNAKRK